jgi:hypothetical protein
MSNYTDQTRERVQIVSADYVIDSITQYINRERSREDEDEETDSDYPSETDGEVQTDLPQSQEEGSKGKHKYSKFQKRFSLKLGTYYIK